MGSGIFFPLSAVPFSILIMILFFQKEQAKNIETKIYKFLLVSNFIGLIIDILCGGDINNFTAIQWGCFVFNSFALIISLLFTCYFDGKRDGAIAQYAKKK